MNLLEKIESDLKAAMKSGDSFKTETLRMVKSDLMYEKAKTSKDLTDEKMLEVVARAAKKRKEASEEFKKGKRNDLEKKELDELVIIETYLPQQMTQDEVEQYIAGRLAEYGSVTKKDFGQIMGAIMKELKGKADGGIVREILQKKLEG